MSFYKYYNLILVKCGLAFLLFAGGFARADDTDDLRQKVLTKAAEFLDQYAISYVFGGGQVGNSENCESCVQCLEDKKPAKQSLLTTCSECKQCSMDCSHFIHWVMNESGLPHPYFPTITMIEISAEKLRKNFKFVDLGNDLRNALPGDILVYDGHVVFLEKIDRQGDIVRGDIIHVTSGRELKGPGMALQRKRHSELAYFTSPLRRILRHERLALGSKPLKAKKKLFRPIKSR